MTDRTRQYMVGGHTYRIHFADMQNDESLIPSSDAFAVASDDQPSLFDLTVDDTFRPQEKGEEIGSFDCDAACYCFMQTDNNDYQIVISDTSHNKCCLMQTDNAFSHGCVSLTGNTETRQFGLNNALMIMYAFAAADKGTLLMHSSVVCNNHTTFLFLGKSGTGKSTHSQLWIRYVPGTELMNDDNPIVRVTKEEIRVYGSPWSGKTDCYRNISAPAGAFVQLQQAKQNNIRRQTAVEMFTSLLSASSVMKWDKRVYSGVCDTIECLMRQVPGFTLQCLPDKAAALLSHTTIAR
ncbi:MAG: hypothetical protein NC206_10515 [Bacteroides sp.]|nr:hypothetical protein [Roseburia sp.]MCM1347500.1 hypothetical protein [Bacteroides sp.]MCM1421639.1 hypothetical protein [Bacteroides sp.]